MIGMSGLMTGKTSTTVDGWLDVWMVDGWMDGQTDGDWMTWKDLRTDRCMDEKKQCFQDKVHTK